MISRATSAHSASVSIRSPGSNRTGTWYTCCCGCGPSSINTGASSSMPRVVIVALESNAGSATPASHAATM